LEKDLEERLAVLAVVFEQEEVLIEVEIVAD